MKMNLFAGVLGAFLMLAPLSAADGPKRVTESGKGDSDVQRAIAFERYKDVASARQARMEAKHPTAMNDNAERRADRDADTQGRKVVPKDK